MQVNGIGRDPSQEHRYEAFYEQILRLQDEVLAGRHPRLKLSDADIAQFRASLSSASVVSLPAVNGAAHHASMDQYPSPSQNITQPSSTLSASIPGLLDGGRKPASTSIDPVLLEKSDDLIRAEIQLKRMRIERALGDAVEERKMEIKAMEPETNFDISEVLVKAHETVVPISGFPLPSEDKAASNDSFDENSYYSSQAMSWSTEESEGAARGAAIAVPEVVRETNHALPAAVQHPVPKKVDGLPISTSTPLASVHHGPAIGQEGEEDAYSPPPLIATPSQPIRILEGQAPVSLDNEEEDMDYEPPAPDALPSLHTQDPMPQAQRPLNGAVFYGNLISTSTGSLPISPPNNDVPVHRNHIETPLAPQPARVSPLATNKVASVDRHPNVQNVQGTRVLSSVASPADQTRRQKHNGSDGIERPSPKNSAQQSPAGPRNGVNNPRKRRRDNDNDRRRGGAKRVAKSPVAARSPEPYIKEEPQSPQPFTAVPDAQASGRRVYSQFPDDVEIISAREYRPRTQYITEYEPHPTYRYHDNVEPSGPIRVYSRPSYRVVDRSDQDLRRIASVQYARRPYSPIASQSAVPADNRPLRAASYAYTDRPVAIQPTYREGSMRPRYTRVESSQSPPSEVYSRRPQSPIMMAPPPKPVIVEDEYGRRFYAAPPSGPPVDIRASMAPPSWHPREAGPYVERAMTREPTVQRPPPLYDEDDRQMPPPPARRYVEPEPEILERPVYRAREFSVRPVEEIRYAHEPMERRPLIRYDEMPPPPPQRDHMVRSHSVRPEALPRASVIREIPAIRYSSVAPGREFVRPPQPLEPAFEDEFGRIEERGYMPAPQHSRMMYGERRLERVGDDVQAAYEGEVRRVNYHY